MDDWRIEIVHREAMLLSDIYLFRRLYNSTTEILTANNKTKIFKQGVRIAPSFTVPTTILPLFVDNLIRKGVKPKEASYNEGKLEAMEKHLNDMQALVFKKNKK